MSTLFFQRTVRLAGVLTNADSTLTIKIVRLDTGATVVATTTTGVTNASTGHYSYTYSSAVAGVSYRATWTLIVSGQTIVASSDQLAVASSGGPTVGELLSILRERGRSVGISDSDDTVFAAASKRLAVQTCLNDFIRRTRVTNALSTISIAEDDDTADFSGISGFARDRLKGQKLYIDGQTEIELPDLGTVLELRRCYATETGNPEIFAFSDESTAFIWPIADDDYTLSVQWSPPLTTFDIGDDASDDVTLNVPRDLAVHAIETGGVVRLLQGKVEDTAIIAPLRVEYEAHVTASMGRNSISGDLGIGARGQRPPKWRCRLGLG